MKRFYPLVLILALACRQQEPPPGATVPDETPAQTGQTASSTVAPAASPAETATSPDPTPTPTPDAPAVAGPKLQPVDQAPEDATLVAYRAQLLAAVRAKDADALADLVDPAIRTSFGGGSGKESLRKMMQREGMWQDLEQVLTLGGSFLGEKKDAFWAPYVFSTWPDSIDAFEGLAVIDRNVPLTGPEGRPIATLSYDIVSRTTEQKIVKTADGKSGTVDPSKLRSPVGYRAGFNKVGGRWRMTGLVAGD